MRVRTCRLALALITAVTLSSQAAPSFRRLGTPIQIQPLPHVTLTVLAENTVSADWAFVAGHPLLAEWGFAVLVEAGGRWVLFDTGAGHVLVDNARTLKVDLSKLDAIVLSHSHGDHTDGLQSALNAARRVDVFLHPAAFDTVFWKQGSRALPAPLPLSRERLTTAGGGWSRRRAPLWSWTASWSRERFRA